MTPNSLGDVAALSFKKVTFIAGEPESIASVTSVAAFVLGTALYHEPSSYLHGITQVDL